MKNSYLYNHANDKCRWLKDFADEANHRPCTSLEMLLLILSCSRLRKCVEVIGWGTWWGFFWFFFLTPPLLVLSRCVLSCPGCSACASGSVWLPFSCVRPLSTTPSNNIPGRGLDGPPSTWSVSGPRIVLINQSKCFPPQVTSVWCRRGSSTLGFGCSCV